MIFSIPSLVIANRTHSKNQALYDFTPFILCSDVTLWRFRDRYSEWMSFVSVRAMTIWMAGKTLKHNDF